MKGKPDNLGNCGTCQFRFETLSRYIHNAELIVVECRANPPTAIYSIGNESEWPVVDPNEDWCFNYIAEQS